MNTLLKRLRAGFSLIEVNMAIFVLAGGALALLALFPMGLRESTEANNEMRIAAFADRFIGAARIAAEQAVDEADFEDRLREALDADNFSLRDDSDMESDAMDYDEDKSGIYYRAWWNNSGSNSGSSGTQDGLLRLEVGLVVTAENPKQNPRAMRYANGYGVKVVIDTRGKN